MLLFGILKAIIQPWGVAHAPVVEVADRKVLGKHTRPGWPAAPAFFDHAGSFGNLLSLLLLQGLYCFLDLILSVGELGLELLYRIGMLNFEEYDDHQADHDCQGNAPVVLDLLLGPGDERHDRWLFWELGDLLLVWGWLRFLGRSWGVSLRWSCAVGLWWCCGVTLRWSWNVAFYRICNVTLCRSCDVTWWWSWCLNFSCRIGTQGWCLIVSVDNCWRFISSTVICF